MEDREFDILDRTRRRRSASAAETCNIADRHVSEIQALFVLRHLIFGVFLPLRVDIRSNVDMSRHKYFMETMYVILLVCVN